MALMTAKRACLPAESEHSVDRVSRKLDVAFRLLYEGAE
jgi:hypothetical protein